MRTLLAAIGLAVLAASATDGRTVSHGHLTEAQVKAGLLYNFISFVEWPPAAAGSVFVIGVVGSDPVAVALRPLHGETDVSRRIEIREVEGAAEARLCQILYIPASRDRQLPALLAALRNDPVLTVGEHEQFTRMGGVIRLYPERARLRLEIDLARAERVNLRISARLLDLARVVRDGHVVR